MIPTLTTAVALLVFVAFALQQAWEDKGGKPAAQHAPDWQGRATFGLAVSLACAGALSMWTDKGFLSAVLGFCLIGYGSFTPLFRWYLNRLRGMDARYVSPSSAYDTFFMRLAFRKQGKHDARSMFGAHARIYNRPDGNTEVVRPNRANLWVNGNWYRDRIHRAGRWAYAVELTAMLIGCGITLAH